MTTFNSEKTEHRVGGAWTRSPNHRVRTLPSGAAAVAVTALLWMISGPLGLVGGGVLLAAWALLPATYAFAIGQIAFVAVTRSNVLLETGLLIPVLVEVSLIGVLVGPAIRSARGRRAAGWTLLGTAILGGITLGSYVLWDPVWVATMVLIGLVALVGYGLHRYELVVLRKVPDPNVDIDTGDGGNTDEDDLDPDGEMKTENKNDLDDDGSGADNGSTPGEDDGLDREDEFEPGGGVT